ncbi:phosphatase PAP2 family protein [Pararhizobium haloflavum]|uniref:phosphatase PAP2 family protein n=1 Tax=Pararhizobium haloflavum TaxID=2037914 RepID=UPI000C173F66|nr:phosphatase PAP2 family protein [Pararhizobium haloflavum]
MQFADLKIVLSRKAVWPAAVMSFLAAGLFVFIELAEEIMEGEALDFDEALLLAFRNPADLGDPLGPPWLEETALELTALGGYPVIVVLTLAVAGYLGVAAWRGAALYVLASVAGGSALSALLKRFFERPRPDIVEQLDVIHTASFPSGHAMVGTVTYLTLGALLVRYAKTRAEMIYVVFTAGVITVLVGLTRVYLGVHWPSDVVAGWAMGLSWAAFVWCVVAVIEYRAQISAIGSRASGYLIGRGKVEP